MAKINPVVHFEMGYKDKGRMVKFYETAFGWKAQQMGPEMGGYVVAQTTDTDENGMVKTPGNINGGFYAKSDNPASCSLTMNAWLLALFLRGLHWPLCTRRRK